jgi:hypothetical protein
MFACACIVTGIGKMFFVVLPWVFGIAVSQFCSKLNFHFLGAWARKKDYDFGNAIWFMLFCR